MMAAIDAANSGAQVVLCEKGCTKRSGGIPGGNDHYFCYIPGVQNIAAKEKTVRQSIMTGIPESLARKWVDRSYDVVKLWESWGADMKINGHYEFTGHGWPGDIKTDSCTLHFSDNNLCAKIEKQVRKRKNINIMDRVMVTELLKDSENNIIGAIGISTREPKLYVFYSKMTIINKGTAHFGRLYPAPNLIGYSMAITGSGDGVITAYRAGANVQDAEIQNLRQVSMRFGPEAGKGTWIGVARNAEGKPIAPPYLAKPDRDTGDPSLGAYPEALNLAWETGQGPVWMDARGISKEDEQYMRMGFESESMTAFLRWVDRENIDLTKTRWEFNTLQPGTNLHLRADADCRTTLPGLYVIPGGSFSWSATIGMVVGEAATKDALQTRMTSFKRNRARISEMKRSYEEILNHKGTEYSDWREAQWAILQTMNVYALPPRRTKNTLMAGYNRLIRIRESTRRILKADNQHDLYHCLEVLNLIEIAELVLLALIERKESRGLTRRQDYPFINPLLNNKTLVIRQQNGRPSFRWEDKASI
jgi:succinate dehydrogenase/fumarate reductase flavoprotein subunit